MVIKAFYWAFFAFFLAHLISLDFVFMPLSAAESSEPRKHEEGSNTKKKMKLKEEDDDNYEDEADEDGDIESQTQSKEIFNKNSLKHLTEDARYALHVLGGAFRSTLSHNNNQLPLPILNSNANSHNQLVERKLRKANKRTKKNHNQVLNRQYIQYGATGLAVFVITILQWYWSKNHDSSHK